jgi:hypothetical protein
LAAITTSVCGTGLSAPFTGILIITHIIELMYSSHVNRLDCFSFFALHLACLLMHYLFEFNLEPLSFTQQSVLMHLLMKLIVLLHSLSFPWHLLLSRIHVLGLGWDDIALDGILTSLHIGHKLLPWFPIVLQKQQPKSFLSDQQ